MVGKPRYFFKIAQFQILIEISIKPPAKYH